MNGSQCHQLLNEGAPRTLWSWAYQALLASFPITQAIELSPHVEQYVWWIETLPTVERKEQ